MAHQTFTWVATLFVFISRYIIRLNKGILVKWQNRKDALTRILNFCPKNFAYSFLNSLTYIYHFLQASTATPFTPFCYIWFTIRSFLSLLLKTISIQFYVLELLPIQTDLRSDICCKCTPNCLSDLNFRLQYPL